MACVLCHKPQGGKVRAHLDGLPHEPPVLLEIHLLLLVVDQEHLCVHTDDDDDDDDDDNKMRRGSVYSGAVSARRW
jgi:hypothetical protein